MDPQQLRTNRKQGEEALTDKKMARIEPENTIEAPTKFFEPVNLELVNGAANHSIKRGEKPENRRR